MGKSSGILLIALLAGLIQGTASPAPQHVEEGSARDRIYASLIGSWTGQLEYRDFQSDKRVALPAWLEVTPGIDGKSVKFAYTYDDGPTKTVRELSTVLIDGGAGRFTITSDRDRASDTYRIEDLDGPNAKGHLQFTLTGSGVENGAKVDVRITIAIDRNQYRFEKETRPAGKEFAFRDGYRFTRRAPPQGLKP